MIYQSINQAVLAFISPATRTLLDVGCGGGIFGAAIKSTMPCTVVGLTNSQAEAIEARARIDTVEVVDLNSFEPSVLGEFECIVCSHVLEHLSDPRAVLQCLCGCLAQNGTLIVALPNVLFWKQRLEFLRGRFRYTEGGLMDSTHVRFFDWASAQQLLGEAGLQICERVADGGVPWSSRFGGTASRRIDRIGLTHFPGLFGFQFVFACGSPASAAAALHESHAVNGLRHSAAAAGFGR
jgi:SAM-dependent methyltransferase